MKRKVALLLALILAFSLASCAVAAPSQEPAKTDLNVLPAEEAPVPEIDESGTYDGKDDVALYLHTYGHLPGNYITKKDARALGWDGGSVEKYSPGKCIGGDYFGNYEGALPDGEYHECDINTLGKSSRGAERIIYSTDGRIYYTGDHYETFELLYGG